MNLQEVDSRDKVQMLIEEKRRMQTSPAVMPAVMQPASPVHDSRRAATVHEASWTRDYNAVYRKGGATAKTGGSKIIE